jgi:hypothetical protein
MNVRPDKPATLDVALTAIAASRLDAKGAAMLQATALRNAERYVGAFGAIARFWDDWLSTTDANVLVQLADIAISAGESSKALEALSVLRVDTLTIELFPSALASARRAGAREVESSLIEKLRQIDPQSKALSQHLIERALGSRDWRQLQSLAVEPGLNLENTEREFLAAMAAALLDDNLVSATNHLVKRFPDRQAMSLVLAGREAIRRRLYPEAIGLLGSVRSETGADLRAASAILDTLELVLFERTRDGGFAIPDEMLAATIGFVASRIATAPRETQLRVKLAHVLSADTIGTRGEALLLFLVESLAESVDEGASGTAGEAASLEEARDFLELVAKLFEGATSDRALMVGAGELPASVTTEMATRLVPVANDALSRMLDDIKDARSLAAAKVVLHAAMLTCIRANARRDAIRMLRGTAVHLATRGWTQDARDIAEHALNWASDDPGELRLAWTSFADVYHRIGDLHDSLVGMLLATSLRSARLTREETWHEMHLMLRLLRDLGLHDEALAMVAKAEPLLTMTPRWVARLESIRLAIELRKHDTVERTTPDASLMERLATNVRQLLDLNEDVTPPLALLMQLIARASGARAQISTELVELVETALSSVPGQLAERLRALGEPNADQTTVRVLASRLRDVRFSEDVGYDIQAAALVTQRALTNVETLEGSVVVELIEMLTDRTLVSPNDATTPESLRVEVDRLVANGYVVHLLGLDSTGRLIRATAEAGKTLDVHRERLDVFNPSSFTEWKKTHPYRYWEMDDPDSVMGDAVRRSVDQLGISHVTSNSTVIVPDVRLSSFPMNLLRLGNEFMGAVQPVSIIPNLSWLASRTRQPRTMTGRRIAWISDALPQGDESPALGPLAERLEPITAEHGIVFSRSPQIPRDLSQADVAIVTAHGSLLPDARFFQVLRDNARERWSPRAIADAVANAGCVVMFVCSAGRHDEHPRARATVGLTRLLLDRQVRAVVASPWPLDTRVPPRWLPTFLNWLDHGEPISDAVFAANLDVSNHFGGNPPHALAMHLYGDPTFRCPYVSKTGSP